MTYDEIHIGCIDGSTIMGSTLQGATTLQLKTC